MDPLLVVALTALAVLVMITLLVHHAEKHGR
ncbi:MAG: hypothetical protein G01um101466_454 [Parcubacteria group bacterium Gr01-1014_66]|nr:MAG: hypothetical protein G01um101466_454 [Parcubacteria group bacterium Gr01-1014_66]